jgi:hypothetical protein
MKLLENQGKKLVKSGYCVRCKTADVEIYSYWEKKFVVVRCLKCQGVELYIDEYIRDLIEEDNIGYKKFGSEMDKKEEKLFEEYKDEGEQDKDKNENI